MDRLGDMVTSNPGTIAFPHTVGGAMIKPEDKGKIKGLAVSAMYEQTDMNMKQIYDQMQLLAQQAKALQDRVDVSERIYQAQMNFQPLISKVYHLYELEDGKDTLSLIGPKEWGRSKPFKKYIATVKLLADHTWDILEKGEGTI
ncbi:hypothetical protein BFP71_12730 [Roseivirga misakiensis]|uniref:DUF2452 domain-containing protein n=2 Tax=Roseivirga misakiensis TaxID=1563681 RepID=A0A1E5T2F1_9BACT|nr:hypothetical protein BFP71_12730 [Roseivirga misakiensis]